MAIKIVIAKHILQTIQTNKDIIHAILPQIPLKCLYDDTWLTKHETDEPISITEVNIQSYIEELSNKIERNGFYVEYEPSKKPLQPGEIEPIESQPSKTINTINITSFISSYPHGQLDGLRLISSTLNNCRTIIDIEWTDPQLFEKLNKFIHDHTHDFLPGKQC